jgi:hypothetical protein
MFDPMFPWCADDRGEDGPLNKKFSKEALLEIVGKELKKSEKLGLKLYKGFSDGEMSEEEFNRDIKGVKGFGIWWDFDASPNLKGVEVTSVKEIGIALYEVSVACDIEWSGTKGDRFDRSSRDERPYIKMTLDNRLALKAFYFHWV